MDEAIVSLDSQSKGIVQKALTRLMKGYTTIVDADKIISIENGIVTEAGTHSELIQSHALYREYSEHPLT